MRKIRFAMTAILIALAGAVPAASAAVCPSQNFPAFLDTFMNDVATQRAFTARPLRSIVIDAMAEPEPKPVTRMIAVPVFPVMPNARKQADAGLRRSVSNQAEGEVEVTLAGRDSDYQMRYTFRKADCWQLYRIEDDSL
ncbi:hypothetical protein [Sphingomonas alpina]|uniref:DUF4864 domain-containing protein n=1 Tax=Sphingomonas alpina TaxID=653931 RepID=A0A7H0LDY9_9SPHN|nr:hypothetical protein [Sphingomonas alpina]QNQ07892.1 hypothetical protein H3Z74_13925 [Sphingomonas alpina]